MKIALFGATGGTGQQILEQALATGHEVRALVRPPVERIPPQPALTVVAGDVTDTAAVSTTLEGADAVISALGGRTNNPPDVLAQGTQNIIEAMQKAGLRRLVVVTSLGVGDSKDQVSTAFQLIAQTVLRTEMQDKERQEQIVRQSDLDWTIVRPGGLADGPPTGDYRAGLDKDITAGRITRADLAAFVLWQLEDDTYIRATPAIS